MPILRLYTEQGRPPFLAGQLPPGFVALVVAVFNLFLMPNSGLADHTDAKPSRLNVVMIVGDDK